MTIEEKYQLNIDLIEDGDIILFKGKEFISKAIELIDKAYFSHAALVMKKDGQLFILDSTLDKKVNGVEVDFLINTVVTEVDFCVMRPLRTKEQIIAAQAAAIGQGIDGIKYNILFYAQFLVYAIFKIDDTKLTTAHADVCSQFVQFYTDHLSMPEYTSEVLITPQYIYDNRNPANLAMIIDKGL